MHPIDANVISAWDKNQNVRSIFTDSLCDEEEYYLDKN